MRSDEVIQAVRDAVQGDLDRIELTIRSLRGGWEGWLQVESALELLGRLGPGSTANREENYPVPNSNLRADLALHPRMGTTIFVELKVQNAFPDDILARFHQDIVKIAGLAGDTRRTHVVVATAFMEVFNAADLLAMRGFAGGTLRVDQWDGQAWRDATDDPVSAPGNYLPTLASFRLN